MEVGRDAVLQTIEKIAAGTYTAIPQDEMTREELRPAPKIFKEDCRIDWNNEGEKIALLIRGPSPYPAAWTPLFDAEGGECGSIKIFKAQFVAGGSLAVGEIKADTRMLEIGCADGRLSILELQMAGKRRMGVEDFLRGVRDMERYCAQLK
jgi:methionyl-tRNA formyltransferase